MTSAVWEKYGIFMGGKQKDATGLTKQLTTRPHRQQAAGVHVQLQQTFVRVIVGGLHSVNWPTGTIDPVSGRIDKPDLVSADAEEPFDSFSDGLSSMRQVVGVTVADSVGTTAGTAIAVVGDRVRMTTMTTRGNVLMV